METDERVIERLRSRADELRREWSAKQPFRYVVIDDLLPRDFAE